MNKNIILLHGAWHASWVWKYTLPKLQSYGFKVWAPDLPGHGSNIHYNFKDIEFQTYIDYIQSILEKMDGEVTLIGHSMAGIIISQIGELMPHKINKLIYLTGFVPDNNGSLASEEEKFREKTVTNYTKVDIEENYIMVNPDYIPHLFYNKCKKEDIDFATKLFQKQPLKPFVQQVNLTSSKFGQLPKAYIMCSEDQAILKEEQMSMASKICCDLFEIDTDHSPFFSNNEELCRLLNKII